MNNCLKSSIIIGGEDSHLFTPTSTLCINCVVQRMPPTLDALVSTPGILEYLRMYMEVHRHTYVHVHILYIPIMSVQFLYTHTVCTRTYYVVYVSTRSISHLDT